MKKPYPEIKLLLDNGPDLIIPNWEDQESYNFSMSKIYNSINDLNRKGFDLSTIVDLAAVCHDLSVYSYVEDIYKYLISKKKSAINITDVYDFSQDLSIKFTYFYLGLRILAGLGPLIFMVDENRFIFPEISKTRKESVDEQRAELLNAVWAMLEAAYSALTEGSIEKSKIKFSPISEGIFYKSLKKWTSRCQKP